MPERTDTWLISTDQTGPCGWWLAEIGSERTGVAERSEAKPVNYPLSVGDQVVFHTQKLLCFVAGTNARSTRDLSKSPRQEKMADGAEQAEDTAEARASAASPAATEASEDDEAFKP